MSNIFRFKLGAGKVIWSLSVHPLLNEEKEDIMLKPEK